MSWITGAACANRTVRRAAAGIVWTLNGAPLNHVWGTTKSTRSSARKERQHCEFLGADRTPCDVRTTRHALHARGLRPLTGEQLDLLVVFERAREVERQESTKYGYRPYAPSTVANPPPSHCETCPASRGDCPRVFDPASPCFSTRVACSPTLGSTPSFARDDPARRRGRTLQKRADNKTVQTESARTARPARIYSGDFTAVTLQRWARREAVPQQFLCIRNLRRQLTCPQKKMSDSIRPDSSS